ncbi:MAG: hypothetical protein Q8N23_00470 [Archangium sp.]|nr:hypothetical protein [Archangium sp.]MDP3571791.1 hypothetical protein [Archangium sp.]
MNRAVLLLLTLSTTALAQAKVPQRTADSECTAGTFTVAGLRVCNLHDALSSVPLVFVNGHFERLDLTASPGETAGHGWVGLVSSKKPARWVGVLDWQVESSGEALVLLVTNDAGKSWVRLPAVKKPHYLATFRSLELKTTKQWILKIALDDCGDCGVPLGTRVYETHDAGGHWAPLLR